jgi:hypothetical protein
MRIDCNSSLAAARDGSGRAHILSLSKDPAALFLEQNMSAAGAARPDLSPEPTFTTTDDALCGCPAPPARRHGM